MLPHLEDKQMCCRFVLIQKGNYFNNKHGIVVRGILLSFSGNVTPECKLLINAQTKKVCALAMR